MKLQKKQRTIEVEFHREPGEHTKEYCHMIGCKTWMKRRHFKKMNEAAHC